MTNKPKALVTYVRDQVRQRLHRAGDTVVIQSPADHSLSRLRIAGAQAAKSEKMKVSFRTIDGELHARRDDLPELMPGLTHNPTDVLLSLRPWPDDPDHDVKDWIIEQAVEALA